MSNRAIMDSAPLLLPRPPDAPPTPSAFMLVAACPGQSLEEWYWQQWVYRQAFERAQAVVRPSLLERDLLGAWN
jgi:hypothetical protein